MGSEVNEKRVGGVRCEPRYSRSPLVCGELRRHTLHATFPPHRPSHLVQTRKPKLSSRSLHSIASLALTTYRLTTRSTWLLNT